MVVSKRHIFSMVKIIQAIKENSCVGYIPVRKKSFEQNSLLGRIISDHSKIIYFDIQVFIRFKEDLLKVRGNGFIVLNIGPKNRRASKNKYIKIGWVNGPWSLARNHSKAMCYI